MNQQDDFTLYHKKLLDGHYDCVDRILLNGSDDGLDQKHLQDMVGRFSRRLRGPAIASPTIPGCAQTVHYFWL